MATKQTILQISTVELEETIKSNYNLWGKNIKMAWTKGEPPLLIILEEEHVEPKPPKVR